MTDNPMKEIKIHKITANIGVGQTGEELNKAEIILQKVTGMKPVKTKCKVKQPIWGLRVGLPIGVKVTMRGNKAKEFLQKALQAKEKKLKKKNFDVHGNFGFGIKEYIDLPGIKYDPQMGIKGLDVLVTLERPGYRVKRRKIGKTKLAKQHILKKDEAIQFMTEKYGVEVQ